MNLFSEIYQNFLYQPIYHSLIFLANFFGQNFGAAIIALTIIIRLLLLPLMNRMFRDQKKIAEIQPQMEEIKIRFKNNYEEQGRKIMELYKKEKINPLSSILSLFIQLPIIFALYQVFLKGIKDGRMNAFFLGINLAVPNLFLAVCAGIFQFIQTKMAFDFQKKQKKNLKTANPDAMSSFSKIMEMEMLFIFPFLTVGILLVLPSAIGLYWAISTLFSILQQYIILINNHAGTKKLRNN